MQEMIGIIASVVIGATIILVLAVISWRGNTHATSAVQYSAAKEGILDFAEVMEEDLSNMASGQSSAYMRANNGGFPNLNSFQPTASPTAYLQFYSWFDRDNSVSNTALNPSADYFRQVRYEWAETGTVQTLDATTNSYVATPTYMIERSVSTGGGAFSDAGSSIDTLTDIEFTFRDIDGNVVDISTPATQAELQSVRTIEVTLVAVSPLGGGTNVDANDPAQRGEIDQTRWTRVIRPPNLIRVTN